MARKKVSRRQRKTVFSEMGFLLKQKSPTAIFEAAFKKQGVSAVAASVLLILVTVFAIALVWAAVVPLISNQLDGIDECLTATNGIFLETSQYTCKRYVNDETGLISIHVSNEADSVTLENVNVLVYSGGSTLEQLQVVDDFTAGPFETGVEHKAISEDLPRENEQRVFKFLKPDIFGGELQAYIDSIDEIAIVPVVKKGNTGLTCDTSFIIELPECSTSVLGELNLGR